MRLLRINARLPQPRISRSISDPLGALPRVAAMDKVVRAKFKQVQTKIIVLFNAIPVAANNASSGEYRYDFSASRAATFLDELQALLDQTLLEGDSFGHGQLWASTFVGDAYQAGTQIANSELSSLSSLYEAQRPIAAILYSEPYLTRLQIAYTSTYSDWKGLSDYSRQQLASTVMEGIARGANPRDVEKDIVNRVGVSESRARQIAQTEITSTLREANRKEVIEARETLGVETIMLWMSALKLTTRLSHGMRHGKFYLPEEIDTFYSEDGNKYNCYCSQTPALVVDGEPVILESSQTKLNEARDAWISVHKSKK